MKLRLIKQAAFLIAAGLVVLNASGGVRALSSDEASSLINDTLWYAPSLSTSCSANSNTMLNSGGGSVDVAAIAAKYGLQSASVKRLNGAVLGTFHADEAPATPASTMKLIIVDTVLRSNANLDKVVRIPPSIEYRSDNGAAEHIGSSITIGDAIDKTFRQSGNTSANVLMYSLGGVDNFTAKANSYGYAHTTVKGYYSAANDGANTSTISDEVAAMDHIFSQKSAAYTRAQNDLIFAAGPFDGGVKTGDNYYSVTDDANKWAGTSRVAGNVGKFTIGSDEYIIGVYVNGSAYNASSVSAVKNGSQALATAVSAAGQSSSGDSTGGSILSGNSSEDQVWNYFKGRGLSDAQVAGIMGNLQQESSFNPTVMEIGGNSNNPGDADPKGYGLAQWTPGSRIIKDFQDNKVSGNVYDLPAQLDLIWAQMNGTSPPGVQHMINGLKQIDDPAQAAAYFVSNFERGTDPNGVRESNAVELLKKHSGQVGSTSFCGGSQSLSPDCQSANDTAKILCAAKAYDTVSYSLSNDAGHQGAAKWHADCPTIGPSCVLDCSGLVNIAVYDVYGKDLTENTYSEASDTDNWKHVPLSQLQPGDLIQPASRNGEHVEIVDHVVGNTIYTFGAHTSNRPQPEQVGPSSFTAESGDLYLHYVGGGNG